MTATSARRLAGLVGDLGATRVPRYAALASRVRLLVADGRLPLGTRLPAERELATALGLSRATVTAAYARLREDGWATARQGAGTLAALPAGPRCSGTRSSGWRAPVRRPGRLGPARGSGPPATRWSESPARADLTPRCPSSRRSTRTATAR